MLKKLNLKHSNTTFAVITMRKIWMLTFYSPLHYDQLIFSKASFPPPEKLKLFFSSAFLSLFMLHSRLGLDGYFLP